VPSAAYPIAIECGDDRHAFGVVVPDLPGCFSAGDTFDEAIENAREAIELWMEGVDADEIPAAKAVDEHQANPDFSGWMWGVIDMDLANSPEKGSQAPSCR